MTKEVEGLETQCVDGQMKSLLKGIELRDKLIENLRGQLTASNAERERLAGIVNTLPRTADEVPIVPGMKLWLRGGIDDAAHMANLREKNLALPPYELGPVSTQVWTDEGEWSASYSNKELYSTRAAALSASAATAGGEGGK